MSKLIPLYLSFVNIRKIESNILKWTSNFHHLSVHKTNLNVLFNSIIKVNIKNIFWQSLTSKVQVESSENTVKTPKCFYHQGITNYLTPHIPYGSSLSPWYFLSFFCSFCLMLLSLGFVTSATDAVFTCLLTTMISGWLTTNIFLSVWRWKFHRILVRSFSNTFGDVVHCVPGASSSYSAQMFLYSMPATLLWRSKCDVPDNILHPADMCSTVSGASLHSQHLGSWLLGFTSESASISSHIHS